MIGFYFLCGLAAATFSLALVFVAWPLIQEWPSVAAWSKRREGVRNAKILHQRMLSACIVCDEYVDVRDMGIYDYKRKCWMHEKCYTKLLGKN